MTQEVQKRQRWGRSFAVGAFFGTLIVGTLTQIGFFFGLQRQPAVAGVTPPPAMSPVPKSLGAAAAKRRTQYENHIQVSVGGHAYALPIETGTADVAIGPVTLTVPAGQTLSWDPTSGMTDIDESVRAVFSCTDVPAEDSTHGVTIQGANQSSARSLDPLFYAAESWTFPFSIVNNTSREAKVAVAVWTNTDAGGSIDF